MTTCIESHTEFEEQNSLNFLTKLLSLTREQIEGFLFGNKKTEQVTQIHLLFEAIEKIIKWSGSRTKALRWYRFETIPAFGDRTAQFVVKSGEIQIVLEYIQHLELGGYG